MFALAWLTVLFNRVADVAFGCGVAGMMGTCRILQEYRTHAARCRCSWCMHQKVKARRRS